MKPLLRVIRYFKPYKGLAIGTLAAATGSTLVAMVGPYLIGLAIDEAIAGADARLLGQLVVGIIVAMLLRDGLNSLRIRLNNRLEQQVIYDMRNEVYRHLQTLPLSFYSDRSTGELMSRVVDDVNRVERVLLDGTEQVFVALLTLCGVAAIMFSMSPSLAWVALIPVPFLALGAWLYIRRRHVLYKNAREKAAAMNAILHDSLSGLLQVKIFNREREQAERFARGADGYRHAQLDIMYSWSLFSPSMNFLGGLGTVLVLIVGGNAIIRGSDTVTYGTLVSFMMLLGLFYEPINRLHSLNNLWQDALAASSRVFEILDTQPDIVEPPQPKHIHGRARGQVDFENVHFAYSNGRKVLHGINLHVKPGETIALVGPTGAGKTTLVQLIPRFYDVVSGAVKVDGIDVRELSLESLRRQIAVVSQEPFLFNATIRENILMGNPDADEDKMKWAAEMANIRTFIERLPQQYDTLVGERGVKLSVGEKQRISIARALLKDAPIVILDEATASVDTITEMQIQEALERLREGRTTFVIAHRLSTVRTADRIACIKDGRIAEIGTHDELMRLDGLYASLVEHQNATGRLDREVVPDLV